MADDSGVRVLIVDDHEMVAEGFAAALQEDAAIEVLGRASTVAEAQRMADELEPDVILMDFKLPDGDGAHAARLIKDAHPRTKIVMLTSATDEAVLAAAVESGCSGFMTKFQGVDDLVAMVHAAASGQVVFPEAVLTEVLPRLRKAQSPRGFDLTPREIEVLGFVAKGLSTPAIAEELHVSAFTVRNHIQSAMTKLRAHSKLEALVTAVREGIIEYR